MKKNKKRLDAVGGAEASSSEDGMRRGLVGSGPFSMQKRTTNSALKRGLS
jgi:hypothetical protein